MFNTTETFFRPEETSRERLNLPAPLLNRCILLLKHSSNKHVFVPIRTMQVQAVIDTDEIIFVDNEGYAVQDGNGGRMIIVAWRLPNQQERDSINQPVPIDVIYYCGRDHDTHRRLMSDFPKAIDACEARINERNSSNTTASILSFRSEK